MSGQAQHAALVRAQTLRALETITERYPNMRIGQILSNATAGLPDLFYLTDGEMGLALNHLFVQLTQLEAAGIKT